MQYHSAFFKFFLLATLAAAASKFTFGQLPAVFRLAAPTTNDSSVLTSYWDKYKFLEQHYNCMERDIDGADEVKVVNNVSFDSLIRPALSNVFVGSNDLTTNATAASFIQDQDKGTLQLNYAILKHNGVFNIGAFAKSSDGIFGIYTANSWSSDVGINFGYSRAISKGLYFDISDCDELKRKRKMKMLPLFDQFRALATLDTTKIHDTLVDLKTELDTLGGALGIDYAGRVSKYKILDSALTYFRDIYGAAGQFPSGLRRDTIVGKKLDSLIALWEIKEANIFTGYKIWWFSVNTAISNNALSFLTDSLPLAAKAAYTPKNLAKFNLAFSLSCQYNFKRYLHYANLSLGIGLHNYLDHPSVKKPGLRYDSTIMDYTVYNKYQTKLATLKDLKANITTFEPSFVYSIFFGKSKLIGLNFRTDMRIGLNVPEEIKALYPNSYNFLIGPLFRMNKDKSFSAGTIGLDVGFVDAPVKTNAWDSFGFKFKVGIPFNAFIK
jgi:hypothetical protein